MRQLSIALLVVLSGGSCSTAATSGPSSSATGSPTASTAAAETLTCRLPVTIRSGTGDSVAFQGGFVSFPAATFTADPEGQIHSELKGPDLVSVAQPVLRGTTRGRQDGVPFYNTAIRRWVPASAAQSTQDGTAYAWASSTPGAQVGVVHIVDTRTGIERTFTATGAGYAVSVLDFVPSGIYLSGLSGIGGPDRGLWLMDPGSGKLTDLKQPDFAFAVRNGYLWSGRHTGPPTNEEYSGPDTIYRVNLSNGARTIWYQGTGEVSLLALDGQDNPIIVGSMAQAPQTGQTGPIRLVDGPGLGGSLISPGGPFRAALGDGNRTWFGSPDGIFLYRPGSGLIKVFPFPGGDSQHLYEEINPAGFCR